MEGNFNKSSSRIKPVISIICGILLSAASVWIISKYGFNGETYSMLVLIAIGLIILALGIISFIKIGKQSLKLSENEILFNGQKIPMDNIASVMTLPVSSNTSDMTVTLKEGKSIRIKNLINSAEISDFIKNRIEAPESLDIAKETEEIGALEKKCRLITALTVAFFFGMISLLVILLIIFYKSGEGSNLTRPVVLLIVDEAILAFLLFLTAKKTGNLLGEINGKKFALRKSILTDGINGFLSVYTDPDCFVRFASFKNSNGMYVCKAEMITEDYSLHSLDTSDEYKTEKELLDAVDVSSLNKIK